MSACGVVRAQTISHVAVGEVGPFNGVMGGDSDSGVESENATGFCCDYWLTLRAAAKYNYMQVFMPTYSGHYG